ncbi:MAG: hypothetical protein COU07_00480 [Candidatus Harrisonbacteria bacterium CG10_big_fil_rev_8_21_14_0_10_40_38]|uniref:Uncharacterized protein n=1 Tax=Candidatus Harrisonbacteria bacterium CG10_big_fil_rev_8_21_14_0_10_40_38 TaxID=1974583 RepID=A0A2H0USI0_9BACT|nr:MAG: hypothetical protein COU07_00480 [Candidatus Harrisonbacteria bacterium CG10_big_fil_rev_8_21_14_0_10_40_38]
MFAKFPEDDRYFSWTRHIKNKMMFYGISTQKIKTILKSPTRREEGIAPNTIAVMKRNDTKKRKEEIWVMYQTKEKRKKEPSVYTLVARQSQKIMISAWRYPGHTKAGAEIPIPEDILEELNKLVN